MSKQTITVLTDDMDGETTKGVQTVHFSLEGTPYKIDLKVSNRNRLYKALRPFIDSAQCALTVDQVVRRENNQKYLRKKNSNAIAIREWAFAQGYSFSKYGRIPHYVQMAYAKAHDSEDED